jgi:threonine/homoserine/homoserine lactone efflux protein
MTFLLAGASLGAAAGVSPGPLMTLVITRTLARGFGAGLRVAIAPLLTDLPIIVISLIFFSVLPPLAETLLTAAGGCFVLFLAWETLRDARHATLLGDHAAAPVASSDDIWRGVLVNLLSPHPWLFWMTVAAPILTRAWEVSVWSALGFVVGFYGLLIGGKILLALAVASGRHFLNDIWYRRLLAASGLLLAIFGLLLLWQVIAPFVG